MATALMAIGHAGNTLGQSQPQASQRFVLAADLQKEAVRIMGLLGVEYGKPMTVIGRWEAPREVAKPRGLDLIVTHVNGRKLELPVIFNQYDVIATAIRKEQAGTPRDGETWEGRCWEGGRYWGHVNVIREELGLQPVSPAHGGFETELHFFRLTASPAKPTK
ncbi:MAG: hypothetical protein SH850_18075 [Planctomycetaceae bacterium]|nr:hypothetical protein [Planctomycetaceae bacterium]